MNTELARFNMIEQQIRPWNVLDNGVLALLSLVKREDFVPPAYRALAFMDTQIPLREGGARGQCMLEPRLEGRLLQAADVQRHHKVLEIGAGSGFMAALLAHKAQHVLSLEIEPELVQMAQANLARASIVNARVVQADGIKGFVSDAPFDVIILSGSVASVPQSLLDQIKVGGKLIAIVGGEPIMRATAITRVAEKTWQSTMLFDTSAPRLLGFDEPTQFRF